MRLYEVIYDRDAESDPAAILAYVAQASGPNTATAFIERIIGYCDGLSSVPHRGKSHDDLKAGLRTVGWRRTVTIAFEVDDDIGRVVILGVYYRDVMAALKERLP